MDESSSPDPSSPHPHDEPGRIIGPDFLPPLPPEPPPACRPVERPGRRSGAALGALALAIALVAGVGMGLAATRPAGPADHRLAEPSSARLIDPSKRSARPPEPAGPPGGVAGDTYAAEEPTTTADLGDRIGFDFRLPEGWRCDALDDQPPGTAAWRCLDPETGRFGVPPTGGVVRVTDCASPCDRAEWRQLREATARPVVPWDPVDEQTMYAENPVDSFHDGLVTVMLSRLYGRGDAPERHLSAILHGPVDDLAKLQKIVNELWERSG